MKQDPGLDRQFLKFSILLCLSGVILSTLGGVAWDNFSSIRHKAATPPIDLSGKKSAPISFRALSGATNDIDVEPKLWWIWNTQSIFELSNPSKESRFVNLRLQLDRNPCGFPAAGNLSFRNSVEVLVPGKPITLTIKMNANSSLFLPLSIISFSCSIDTDPRIFVASLTSSFSFSSENEFNFEKSQGA